ncbi:MAG: T9SS type A sorting domain-containing protein [Flavobacteriales bacterium]|nr:T9SS type A sorting domain-containing protein [Flavobacteriales bacterium]
MEIKKAYTILLRRNVSYLLMLCLVFVLNINEIKSQTVVYSEGFNSTLGASGWTITDLTVPFTNTTFFGFLNTWQVSDAESGMAANTCGAGGAGNSSLHCGAVGLGALGAAYISNARTNRRISSPNTSTIGSTNLTLSFNYIGNGEANDDRAYLQYSINGGPTWVSVAGGPTTSNPALPGGASLNNLKSQICGGGQGRWTNITWAMPVACENIPNLRVAFVWQNDDDAIATDPSFAVDDVIITKPAGGLPIALLSFNTTCIEGYNELSWKTATEINNDFYTIEKSIDAKNFEVIARVNGAGNSNNINSYYFKDKHFLTGQVYYRLKQTDFNGNYEYFDIKAVDCGASSTISIYPNPARGEFTVTINQYSITEIVIEIYNSLGQKVIEKIIQPKSNSINQNLIIDELNQGIYFVKLKQEIRLERKN